MIVFEKVEKMALKMSFERANCECTTDCPALSGGQLICFGQNLRSFVGCANLNGELSGRRAQTVHPIFDFLDRTYKVLCVERK